MAIISANGRKARSATAALSSSAATCRRTRSAKASRPAWRDGSVLDAVTDTKNEIPSVAERARPIAAGAPVVGVHFLKGTAAFVLGEEVVLLAAKDGQEQRVIVHGGAILAAAADGKRVV